MARMNPLKKYAVGMAAIAAVSGAVGFAQTILPNTHSVTTPTAQVQQTTPTTVTASDMTESASTLSNSPTTVVDAVDPAEPLVQVQPVAQLKVRNPETDPVITDQQPTTAVDTYVEPAESDDDYVWVEERHEDEHEYEGEDQYEGGGYDE